MRKLIGVAMLAAMLASPTVAFAKKSKVQLAKDLAAEIAKNEAWNKAKEKAKAAYKKEKNCHNTQGGNNANSTAAVRVC